MLTPSDSPSAAAVSRFGQGEIRGIPVPCSEIALELGKIVGACDERGNFWHGNSPLSLLLCQSLFCEIVDESRNYSVFSPIILFIGKSPNPEIPHDQDACVN